MKPPQDSSLRQAVCYALILGLFTFLLFSPVRQHDFINYDDPLYVTESPLILAGLSWQGVERAILEPHAFMWHPLTTISHQMDVSLYGLEAGAHHLTSVILHSVSAGLLFLLLRMMTGSLWRSLLVAAVFAWHPLRVESVAWISERKDVLCTLFWILTLFAYVRYVRETTIGNYLLLFVVYLIGITTKPLIVTLPCLLLLLDVWPLKRMPASILQSWQGAQDGLRCIRQLFYEKIPLFALSFLLAYLTWKAQSGGGIIRTMGHFSLGERLGNALISYVRYLGKLVWPQDLVVFYPHPGQWPVVLVLGAGILLVGITCLVFRRRQSAPWEMIGWFWFLGLLVPAIGIVQAGGQAMADRYTYFSTVGIVIALIWTIGEMMKKLNWPFPRLAVFAGLPLVLLGLLTARQLTYWRNSESLFRHVLAASPGNIVGYENLSTALMAQGKLDEAVSVALEGLKYHPKLPLLHNNLGLAYSALGQRAAAVEQYQIALTANPDFPASLNNLGNLLREDGKVSEAARLLEHALLLEPEDVEVMNNLALVYEDAGRKEDASRLYQKAIGINPSYAQPYLNLGVLFYEQKRFPEAINLIQQAVALKPQLAQAQAALFFALAEAGRLAEAKTVGGNAIRLAEQQGARELVVELQRSFARYGLPKP